MSNDNSLDHADLSRAIDDVEKTRECLRTILDRGSFPSSRQVMRVDNDIRDIIGRLRAFLRESEEIIDGRSRTMAGG